MVPEPTEEQKMHRQMAVDLFNHVWDLMDKPERSPAEVDDMIHSAHASRYHWGKIGTPLEFSRGEWQISRVYCVLKRAEPALFHARRTLDLCLQNQIGDFDLAFAYEALARAHLIAGDLEECKSNLGKAHQAAKAIHEEDDLQVILTDLQDIQNHLT